MMENLKQGTKVRVLEARGFSGFGTIVGQANNGNPILGIDYIIQIDEGQGLPSEIYPYTNITCCECWLEILDPNIK